MTLKISFLPGSPAEGLVRAASVATINSLVRLPLTRLRPPPSCPREQEDPRWQDQSPRPLAVAVLPAERAERTHLRLRFDRKEMGLDSSTLLWRVRGLRQFYRSCKLARVNYQVLAPLPSTLGVGDDLCRMADHRGSGFKRPKKRVNGIKKHQRRFPHALIFIPGISTDESLMKMPQLSVGSRKMKKTRTLILQLSLSAFWC